MPGIRVVLVRPRRGGNVGSVARAMKNMGLGELVLVGSRTSVGAVGARMAAHAGDVLQRRRSVATLDEAIADCRLVVGTIGRDATTATLPRAAREAAPAILAAARRGRVAIVFGPEDHGLSNSELDRCQMHVRIPTGSAYPSMNLAQAVCIVAYEIHLARGAGARPRPGQNRASRSRSSRHEPAASPAPHPEGWPESAAGTAATSGQREAMMAHLSEALAQIGFLPSQNPEHILRDVRSLFARAGLTERDARIWRGVARQMIWAARAGAARGSRRRS